MKKNIFCWASLAIFCTFFLSACGNNDDGEYQYIDEPSITDYARATLVVNQNEIIYKPPMVRDFFVHLSDGTKAVFVHKEDVSKIFFNGGKDAGWHSDDETRGIDLRWDASNNPEFVLTGQPLSPSYGANFSFLLKDGREYSQITDAAFLDIIIEGEDVFAEVKSDGLIYGSYPEIVVPDPPVIKKTLIEINTTTGEVEITPAVINGVMINLVDSNPLERILGENGQMIPGYKLVWNDYASWYPVGGTSSDLLLPKTVMAGATMPVGIGAGMPYLVKPDGSYVPFNTDPTNCTCMVNGSIVQVANNGLFYY